MAASTNDVDPAFQGAGQKAGIEIWRIENFCPVPIPKSSHGKFFSGDSYIVLKTTELKSGALRQDIHFWLGKDTSQDEAGAAAVKTVELDDALNGNAVQYREVQGSESEKFLSYFKPCIIPQEGGVASGFKHAEAEEHKTRLYVCKAIKRVVQVKEVPFDKSSLSEDDIFILDTKDKIFQFNGAKSSIQERGKSFEVVQYVKDTYHDGKCDVVTIESEESSGSDEGGEFWGFFGGYAPISEKASIDKNNSDDIFPTKLYSVGKGQAQLVEADSLTKDLLDTNGCFLLDCGIEIFVWVGKDTSLDARKDASEAAEELVRDINRPKAHTVRVKEGFETVMFKSKFESWPQSSEDEDEDDE